MSFFEQMKQTADKPAKEVTSLSRSMTNVVGLNLSTRRLLMTAIQSVLLYVAEMWADELDKKVYRKHLSRVQKPGGLRMIFLLIAPSLKQLC